MLCHHQLILLLLPFLFSSGRACLQNYIQSRLNHFPWSHCSWWLDLYHFLDLLFCGMCIGYRDDQDPINTLQSERRPLEDWAKFI